MRPFAGILCDFDGVVAGSSSAHHAAWERACTEILGNVPDDALAHERTGASSREIATALARSSGFPERAADLNACKLHYLLDGPVPHLLPGACALFAWCAAEEIACGIASNTQTAFLARTIRHHALAVTAIAGFDVPGVRPKPAPDLWLHVAQEAGIQRNDFDRVLVFEDAVPGVLGAREAGMIPIGIGQKRESLIAAGVHQMFDNLDEWLKTQRAVR